MKVELTDTQYHILMALLSREEDRQRKLAEGYKTDIMKNGTLDYAANLSDLRFTLYEHRNNIV